MEPANEGKCWAEVLGGCGGPITREHLATKALFKGTPLVKSGNHGALQVRTSFQSLTANILCRDHNSELGRTADAAALRLSRALEASHHPTRLRGADGPRPPVDRKISGTYFGRWLCKTHCNYMVANGMTPDPAYIRYAFQKPTGRPIYIYFAGDTGEAVSLATPRNPPISWTQHLADDPNYDGFSASLAGFESIVTTAPVKRNGKPMLDRVRALEWPTPLGPFRIILDWSDEPAGSATL